MYTQYEMNYTLTHICESISEYGVIEDDQSNSDKILATGTCVVITPHKCVDLELLITEIFVQSPPDIAFECFCSDGRTKISIDQMYETTVEDGYIEQYDCPLSNTKVRMVSNMCIQKW